MVLWGHDSMEYCGWKQIWRQHIPLKHWYPPTWCHNSEDHNLNNHYSRNFVSFLVLLHNALRSYTLQHQMLGWQMDWIGFGKKWSWPKRGTTPVFTWRDWWKYHCQGSQCSSQETKWAHPEYGSSRSLLLYNPFRKMSAFTLLYFAH